MMTDPRAELIERATRWLESRPEVRAAWLGGADASDRVDRWSDVDLVVAARDEAVESVLLELIEALGPHRHRTRFAQPTFHGHEQIVARPEGVPDWCLVDLVVMRASTPPDRRFLQPEQHGRPEVLLDRDRLADVHLALDHEALAARVAQRVLELRERFHLFRTLVERAIERGHVAEAGARYQQMVLSPLVELARCVHCPERHAFGARYLDRDLPDDLRASIEVLVPWPDAESLRSRIAEATALFAGLEADWDAGRIRAPGEAPVPGDAR